MRRSARLSTLSLTFSVLAVPLVVMLPTVPSARPVAPHSVAPRIHTLAFTHADQAAAARQTPGQAASPALHRLALTAPRVTAPFSLVGITWSASDASTPVEVSVRTRSAGDWTDWHDLEGLDDVAADLGSADVVGSRAGTAPYWVGPSDGVQVRVDGKRRPRDLRIELIDPGSSAADSGLGRLTPPASSAAADVAQPAVVSRKGWGADESLRSGSPDYAEPIKVAFVHHTDTTNSYTAAQSASIVRSIYAYHTKSRGWSDIGYNFLIDKYGTVFEGRAGGIDRAVLGAHTGGFNSQSFAASLMGNFTSVTPPAAMMSSLSKLIAWKLARGYLDPTGKAQLTSSGGGTSRYSSGTKVAFNVISGHRDAGYTSCPGTVAYGKLGALRSSVKALMGASFVAPSVSPTSRGVLDPGVFTVRAGAVNPLSWTLTVTSAATGLVVRTVRGSASGAFTAAWDGLGEGATVVPPGRYVLRLDATAGASSARPWTATVELTSPVSLTAPPVAGWNSQVTLTGRAPAGREVTLEVRRGASDSWEPLGTVTSAPDGSFSQPLTLDDDVSVRASAAGFPSPELRIRIAPTVLLPTAPTYGAQVTISGTSRPADTVTLRYSAPGQAGRTETATADDQGRWSTSLTATASWVITATARAVSGAPTTLLIRPTLAPAAPLVAPLRSSIPVTGTAGAGDLVQVQVQRDGEAGWSTVSTPRAGSEGAWSAAVALVDDLTIRAVVGGLVSTVTRSARVRPTAAAPATAGWGAEVPLRGTARPGSAVTVQLTTGATTTTRTTTASSDGAWSVPFTLTQSTTWKAVAGGLESTAGTTAVVPVLTPPASVAVGQPARFAGVAPPGATVGLRALLPGAAVFADRGTAKADAEGRFAVSVTPDQPGRLEVRGVLSGVEGPSAGVLVVPAQILARYRSELNAVVPFTGSARPGSLVRVEVKPRTQAGWTTLTTLTASAGGDFAGSFRLRDDTSLRAVTPDGVSAATSTRVGPTLVVPATATPGTRIPLTGTARPGGRVDVYIKHSFDRTYISRGYAVAGADGRWLFRWAFSRYISVYVKAGGLGSATLTVAPR